jgi:hypothetical protein
MAELQCARLAGHYADMPKDVGGSVRRMYVTHPFVPRKGRGTRLCAASGPMVFHGLPFHRFYLQTFALTADIVESNQAGS